MPQTRTRADAPEPTTDTTRFRPGRTPIAGRIGPRPQTVPHFDAGDIPSDSGFHRHPPQI